MYIDSATIKGNKKSYTRHLLRTSFRENGKVKHKTIANLSSCSEEEIVAIKFALKHKKELLFAQTPKEVKAEDLKIELGKRIGAVWVLNTIAQRLGIEKALGDSRDGKLALIQVIARIIDHGSRLSAVRFAESHAVCEICGINRLDEDDLYENLAWLSKRQEEIEKKLFHLRFPNAIPTLFLYDVTSSYLEGEHNELADWGYNRDKKKGKLQIVVGLLADPDGLPVAIRVFKGNTPDTKTVSEQVRILTEAFGAKEVTLVGDRGMLKGPQIKALPDDFRYITAITKPQILKMLESRVLQYELFTERICEVVHNDVRYILRRNPFRSEQIAAVRQSKQTAIEVFTQKFNEYLAKHGKASPAKALKKVNTKITDLKCDGWLSAAVREREIILEKNESALEQAALLDGCYVIKSDVLRDQAKAQTLHDRYCDLENVERTFRTMKSVHLEMRPVFVRKEESTKGHAFVVMLALLLQRKLEKSWADLNITVEEGIDELASIRMQEVFVGNTRIQNIPIPTELGKQLIEKAGTPLPTVAPCRKANVHTKKKLQTERLL